MKVNLLNSIAGILDNKSKQIVGTCLLVSKDLLITTDYVVKDALNIARETPPPENSSVYLKFPLSQEQREWTATVEYWSSEVELCILRCTEKLPSYIIPVSLIHEDELWGHPYRTFGFPREIDGGIWSNGIIQGAVANELIQLADDGVAGLGFGGSPVFDEHLHYVVGIIVGRWSWMESQNGRSSTTSRSNILFMLPVSKIEKHLDGIVIKHMKHTPVQVFLCHASPDKMAVRQLYVRLREDGFSPWFDEENLLPGQKWDDEIRKAVRSSDVIAVCLSKNATNKSGYVQKEIKMALDIADEKPEGHIFVIPLKLEECEVPDRLQSFQWVDLFKERGYDRLKSALSFVRNQKKGR